MNAGLGDTGPAFFMESNFCQRRARATIYAMSTMP
ncbi:hypothetical protein Poly41_44750 [Novipirellula artificiosorum]|uniref:Uncharacterized protein n=1 Tax=Novipirellula artificiosorum TaxID=2528016 RepID=A0A5C6DCC9_9BACT|nr:hypothetical protein Poly41_44750 [Novipirellula artificiosorum]